VAAQLERLKSALESDSMETLRREVVGSVAIIGRTLEGRNQRQQQQMAQLGSQLESVRAELTAAKQAMSVDALTRLYNRASFDEMLERIAGLSLWSGQTACLLMVDVDGFKTINDNHGHPAGDAALTALARVMLRTFPRKGDFVSRYAGDEFAIILQDTSGQEGLVLAERLLMAVRTTSVAFPEHQIDFTVSIGLAELQKGDTPARWMRRADAGLYAAKQAGRNRVVLREDVK
jgi:diguanylate cyclase (GGDEF)-like protein